LIEETLPWHPNTLKDIDLQLNGDGKRDILRTQAAFPRSDQTGALQSD
jgi:hypothetical protein